MNNTLCKKIDSKIHGMIHSIESLGTLDGPGLRTVVFMQGCPLKCKYCHNVDSTLLDRGTKYSVDELVEKILKNKEYWVSNIGKKDVVKGSRFKIGGGVTFSGGEPTFQYEFVSEVLKKLKAENIHTALDTSLFCSKKAIDTLFPYVDYWMVSVKHLDNEKHKELTGVPNSIILRNLKYLDKRLNAKHPNDKKKLKNENEEHKAENVGQKNIRIRFVLIPGITDSEEYLRELGVFVGKIKSLDFLEILPYTAIGKFKWIELFGEYPFEGVREATDDNVRKANKTISKLIFNKK